MSKNLSNVKASPKTQGGSVEEEIRKHAKTPSEVYETADAFFDKIRYGKTREQRARLRQEWLDYLRSKKGWVFIDIVLGVVAQLATEHKEKCEGFSAEKSSVRLEP